MILFAKNKKGEAAKLTVVEAQTEVWLHVDSDNDGLGVKTIRMTTAEASALADMLNRIRRKVAERPEWRP